MTPVFCCLAWEEQTVLVSDDSARYDIYNDGYEISSWFLLWVLRDQCFVTKMVNVHPCD